jgi:hypothetical protein
MYFRLIFILGIAICNIAHSQIWESVDKGVTFHNSAATNVTAMCVYNNQLYVAGLFDSAGSLPTRFHARWDGSTWDSVGLGFKYGVYGRIESYLVLNNELYVGGNFRGLFSGLPFPYDLIPHTQNLAKWNGTSWSSVTTDEIGSTVDLVNSIAFFDNQLYIAGTFNSIGTQQMNAIGSWNGNSWLNVGGGVSGAFQSINKLINYSGELIAIGDFLSAGGKQTNFIAAWNGNDWDSVGGGFDYIASEVEVDTNLNQLNVGGLFYYAGDTITKVNGSANWNGSYWSPLDTNLCADFRALCSYRNKLYAGGNFKYINCNNGATFHLAYFDGNYWIPVFGPNNEIDAMCVFHDTLFIGGYFDTINVTPFNHVAKYFIPSTEVKENIINNFNCSFIDKTKLMVELNSNKNIFSNLFSVYDCIGRLKYRIYLQPQLPNNKFVIDIFDLKPGLYIIQMVINDSIFVTKKIIKN